MNTPAIGLSPELFATVFPFHLAFNRDRQLVQLGNALQQMYPDLAVGDAFEQHFHIARPIIALDFDTLQQQSYSLFLLNIPASGMKLKGQMLYVPELEAMLFLGSPWTTDIADLLSLGLKLTDYSFHKSIVDYLLLLQMQKTALADIRKLVDKLVVQQRAEIQRTWKQKQELDDMKSRFVTNMSHEFRTPLGIISSSAGILQDYGQKVNDELRQKHLLRIQSAVQRITALLEDVLLMNRLEQDK